MRSEYITPARAAEVRGALSPANRLVLDFCGETGFRVGDAVCLERAAVLAALERRCWLTLTEHKTGKVRRVRVARALLEALLAFSNGVYIFPNRDDKTRHRTRQAVWGQLAAHTQDWPEHVSPHSYRKLYAVRMWDECHDLERVRRKLNHAHDSLTLFYIMSGQLAEAAAKRQKGKQKNA